MLLATGAAPVAMCLVPSSQMAATGGYSMNQTGNVSLATALALQQKSFGFMSLWFYLFLFCLSGDCRYNQ